MRRLDVLAPLHYGSTKISVKEMISMTRYEQMRRFLDETILGVMEAHDIEADDPEHSQRILRAIVLDLLRLQRMMTDLATEP